MRSGFSILKLSGSPEKWDCAGELRKVSGKYIVLQTGKTAPDPVRIREMLRQTPSGADLIFPIGHTTFPQEEFMEEPLVEPLQYIVERFRIAPLLNGVPVRKKILLEAVKKNEHDWIHSPCPELFFLLFQPMKAAIVRTEYSDELCDRETLLQFCRQYRAALEWLNRLPLDDQEKTRFRSLMLQYEDYLIDCADKQGFTEKEFLTLFRPVSCIHNFFIRRPEKLLRMKLPSASFRTGPVRNLAVICWALRTGGAERCISLLLKYFAELSDLKITLIQCSPPAPGDYPCPENVEVEVIPFRFYERCVRMTQLLKEKRIDTCIFSDHSQNITFFDILAAKELGIRTIAMEHNTFSFPLYSGDIELMQLRQVVYSVTDMVTCLSRSDEYMWATQGIRVRYMPNPLTFGTEHRPPFTERKTKNLIFIARMTPGKGVLDAIKVVEIVRKKHPDIKLFMLGSFPHSEFEQEIRGYIREHGLDGNLEFTGFTAEVGKYMDSASIHLMPSQVEGYPMTLMEAKSCGLPTVAYSLPYLEAGREEYGTLSVPQGDYRAMAGKVSELFDDFGKLNELGRVAWASLKYFDNEMVFRRWAALFRWLETGNEPEDLAVPENSESHSLELLKIQTQEIVSGISAITVLPVNRKKLENQFLKMRRREDILLDTFMRFYFNLRKKIYGRPPYGMKIFFAGLWFLKKIYRRFKPWKEEEQEL